MKKNKITPTIKKWFIRSILFLFLASILSVILFRFVPIPITLTMIDRVMEDEKDLELKYTWKSKDEIDDNLKLAALASEDQLFFKHNGFDWNAIEKAYDSNQNGGKLRGGSTISQQVAKNVFLWQGRSYIRKALEVYFTFLIETLWSKDRILEVYLNVAETGILTFGVEEGCNRYFKHGAGRASKIEAAELIAILPNPRKWNVSYGKKTQHIIRQMSLMGSLEMIKPKS